MLYNYETKTNFGFSNATRLNENFFRKSDVSRNFDLLRPVPLNVYFGLFFSKSKSFGEKISS